MAPIGGFNDEDMGENYGTSPNPNKIKLPNEFSYFISAMDDKMEVEVRESVMKDYKPFQCLPAPLKGHENTVIFRPSFVSSIRIKLRRFIRHLRRPKMRNYPGVHLYPRIETIIRDHPISKDEKRGNE